MRIPLRELEEFLAYHTEGSSLSMRMSGTPAPFHWVGQSQLLKMLNEDVKTPKEYLKAVKKHNIGNQRKS